MNTFQFGCTRQRLTRAAVKACKEAAKADGAQFHYVDRARGFTHTGWFSAPNMGAPFDRAVSESVLAEVARRGVTL